jgi:hypothetical protein
MNDEEFEAELARLRPSAVPRDLIARLAEQLDESPRLSLADRCLMTFMGGGALAASLIVGLLTWQMTQDHSPRSMPSPALASNPPASIADYQQALARSDGPGLELFR